VATRGRRIAFDYGDVRTGVALSDPDAILASPLCVLQTQSRDFLKEVNNLLAEHEPIQIFVGLPKNMSGTAGEAVEKVNSFIENLKGITSVDIATIDERLSTVSAQKRLREAGINARDSKVLIDAMAAVAILEQGIASEN
jgi:putative Holliday junction resolvase